MKVKIISDGTARGTKVVNAETGEPIEGITSIDWSINSIDMVAVANILFKVIPIEALGDELELEVERTA